MPSDLEPVHFLSSRAPSAEYTPLIGQASQEYEIAPLPSNRRQSTLVWKKWLLELAPLTCTVALVFQWIYFAVRLKFAVRIGMGTTSIFLVTVITAEFLACLPTLLSYPFKMFAGWIRPAKHLRLLGDSVPTVDVVITCCGEPLDVLEDTIEATLVLDYPRDCFRVIVSDDGNSVDLHKSVQELQTRFPNIFYTARKIGSNHGYKAGNLNHAFALAEELPGGPLEYVASLDSDMIPQPDWLRALLPHLILDARVGMASPPQLYYNIPPNDPLQQSLIPFFDFMEPLKQMLGVAWCTGSGYIMRRSAIESIGGFPTYSLAEDVFTSSLMLGAGWKTIFVNEPVQHGLMPDTLSSHLKQRTRWNIGGLQTAYKMRSCLFGPNARHMKFSQRISGLLFPAMIISNAIITIPLFAIPLALLLDFPLIGYSSAAELHQLLALAALAYSTVLLNELVLSVEVGFRNAMREIQATHWMAPYHAVALVQAFLLPAWLGGRTAVFSASGSLSNDNERDRELRAPWWRRVPAVLFGNMLWIHALLVLANAAGLVCVLVRELASRGGGQNEYLLTHLGWPPLLCLMFTWACGGPIWYALFPPDMPAREELMDRDRVSGVAYPKVQARKLRWTWGACGYEFWFTGAVVYALVIWIVWR